MNVRYTLRTVFVAPLLLLDMFSPLLCGFLLLEVYVRQNTASPSESFNNLYDDDDLKLPFQGLRLRLSL